MDDALAVLVAVVVAAWLVAAFCVLAVTCLENADERAIRRASRRE